ncbi:MAG TPA: adenylate/guanylate cyclase domain-containing protein [Xanthobacteraceae bacterium]|nr:adenylate/guanylate cyclase domain-containing protein [Xanthobacteraceae bacterium]
MDIADWLRQLDLEQYIPAFAENAIDWSVLSNLTVEDLREIGVGAVGHRRKLLTAIAALSAAPAVEPARSGVVDPGVGPSGAERRQLTVMFCDLVGSTALATRLDPEDLREVIGAYHRAVAEQVGRFGGYVAKYMGDGVLIYFGYPQAHEDDAERAVRTGLALAERLPNLAANEALAARIGIATGLVVVGDLIGQGEAQERGVVGETPNLAARLQALAPPGGVLIAEVTRRLLGDLFEYENLGAVDLKGFDASVPVWQVLRPSEVESRFEALRTGSAATAPLIGRDEELDLLLRRWERAASGEGQLVLLSGEAGIGKSRLTAALQERLREVPHTRLRYFCSPHHQDSALAPFIAQLERAAGFSRDDSADVKRSKLAALLGEPDSANSEAVGLIADLLCVASEAHYPPLPADPQRRREATLATLVAQLERLSCLNPILMIFEDAHWADASSLELLDRAVERMRLLPVLLVVTHRPEFAPPWVGQAGVATMALSRLGGREAAALAGNVAGGKSLPYDILDRIVERTDGIPLFIEELTKSLIEGGLLREDADGYALAGPLPAFAIPSSLQASLLARLDRLAPVREVAQIGAAIGREFSHELLAAVARHSERQLGEALDQLTFAGLVQRRGAPPRASYVFKHALVQDAAYSTLLRGPRQELHARIASELEQRFPETRESRPEILAQHYAEAGLADKSVEFWARAGRASLSRSASAEAAAQFRKALEQLERSPDGTDRKRRELELISALGAVLFALKGHPDPETGQAFAHARELWEAMGSPPEFLRVPYGQSRYHSARGEHELARRLDADLLRVSEERNDSAGLIIGHLSTGRDLFYAGEFASARLHLEQAVSLDHPSRHRSMVQQTGIFPCPQARVFLGTVLSCMGFLERGLKEGIDAVTEARRLSHLPTLASCLGNLSNIFVITERLIPIDVVVEQAAVADGGNFAMYSLVATFIRGWRSVQSGDIKEGIECLQDGFDSWVKARGVLWSPYFGTLLARARGFDGDFQEGLRLLDDALRVGHSTGEIWLAAEMYRHKATLVKQCGKVDEAATLCEKALNLAVEQGAKLWELRAAKDLARLWREQGRRVEAREVLAPVYNWFTEDFDTADLKEAKALLDELQ